MGLRALAVYLTERREAIGSTIISFGGLLLIAISVSSVTNEFIPGEKRRASVDQLQQDLIALRSQVDQLKSDTYSEGDPVKPMDSGRVVALEEKLKVLEVALGSNVERALALPMLRKDVDQISASYEKRLSNVENNVDRIYGLMVWLIGIVVSIALAAGGLVISRRKPNE